MTLKERTGSDSRLENGMIRSERRPRGVEAPPAEAPPPFVGVSEFKVESPRSPKTAGVEVIARQTDRFEDRLSQTDVH